MVGFLGILECVQEFLENILSFIPELLSRLRTRFLTYPYSIIILAWITFVSSMTPLGMNAGFLSGCVITLTACCFQVMTYLSSFQFSEEKIKQYHFEDVSFACFLLFSIGILLSLFSNPGGPTIILFQIASILYSIKLIVLFTQEHFDDNVIAVHGLCCFFCWMFWAIGLLTTPAFIAFPGAQGVIIFCGVTMLIFTIAGCAYHATTLIGFDIEDFIDEYAPHFETSCSIIIMILWVISSVCFLFYDTNGVCYFFIGLAYMLLACTEDVIIDYHEKYDLRYEKMKTGADALLPVQLHIAEPMLYPIPKLNVSPTKEEEKEMENNLKKNSEEEEEDESSSSSTSSGHDYHSSLLKPQKKKKKKISFLFLTDDDDYGNKKKQEKKNDKLRKNKNLFHNGRSGSGKNNKTINKQEIEVAANTMMKKQQNNFLFEPIPKPYPIVQKKRTKKNYGKMFNEDYADSEEESSSTIEFTPAEKKVLNLPL